MTKTQFTTDSEEWKDIPNYRGYQVSNLGRVRSYWRRQGTPGAVFSQWKWGISDVPKILKQRLTKKAQYRYVVLQKFVGKQQIRQVHQLVLEAFVGPRPDGEQARHLDDNKADNRLQNLGWGTVSKNMQERFINNRTFSVLKPIDIPVIREMLAMGQSQKDVAKHFHVDQSAISRVNTGARWGYIK